jgi:ABC-type Fe3+-siderophore transport system permease subunit
VGGGLAKSGVMRFYCGDNQMRRTFGVLQLCSVSASVLLLGFALCFPFFSFLPLLWSAGLVATLILYSLTCVVLRRKAAAIAYLVIGVIYSIAFSGVVTIFTGVHRVEQFACEWNAADADLVEIDLGSIGGFGKARVESEQLIGHLRKVQPPKVQVTVRIIRDFGRVRARGRIEQIDGIHVHEVGWQ